MQTTLTACALALLIALPVLGQQSAAITQWPPREYLLKGLVDGTEGILKSQDPATGRFGTQPWICTDQNVLFPLAAVWAIQDPNNPWYHSDRVLQAIAKGGDALVDDQDANGMWIFRKKDNSTWGQIHMPWTYSRWIRAYVLVKEALSAEDRAKWEKGLLLGFTGIRRYMNSGVQNIPAHHAMGLFIAGVAFKNQDWQDAARAYMAKVVAAQDPAGFWSENVGPVIGYNEVYVDALGVYYHFSQDPIVTECLQRAAAFHSAILWPDGSSAACFDERQIYHAGVNTGTVGFTFTPEGRGFLLQQVGKQMAKGSNVGGDYAASMLLYGDSGPGTAPAAAADEGSTFIGDKMGLMRRHKPWQWAMNGYTCPIPTSRWIQDWQNMVDVYLDGLGVVIGGGNTKLQPYWSTFTVGDCSLLKHTAGDENPDFAPAVDLLWSPSSARITNTAQASRLALTYGEQQCSVSIQPQSNGTLRLSYEAPGDKRIEAHVPFLRRAAKITCASGKTFALADQDLLISATEIGAWFSYGGLRVSVPSGASLRWPARQHDPYKKDGSSPLSTAKLVLCLPFAGGKTRYDINLQPEPQEQFPGHVFEAQKLKSKVSGDGYTKSLDEFGSQLLGAQKPGAALTFTLPAVKAGKYELLGEFVLASVYGIVQVSVDGKPVGKPFDAYCPDVDAAGERVSFGTVNLTARSHRIKLQVIGKNDKSTNYLISVKNWLLRPL